MVINFLDNWRWYRKGLGVRVVPSPLVPLVLQEKVCAFLRKPAILSFYLFSVFKLWSYFWLTDACDNSSTSYRILQVYFQLVHP